MKKYKIFINGKNFQIKLNEKMTKCGFYTTKYIEANNPEEARSLVMDMLSSDDKLKDVVKNDKNDPPIIYADEISEVESFDSKDLKIGISWYKETSRGL